MRILDVLITPNIISYYVSYRTNTLNKLVQLISISHFCLGNRTEITKFTYIPTNVKIVRSIRPWNAMDFYLNRVENS